MKTGITLFVCLCLSAISFSQGTSCNTAYALTLDGVCRNYTISSAVDDHTLCPGTGDHPITFFSFTTNAAADPVLLDITTPGGQPCEILMYTGCGASNPQGYQSNSSMCFTDGEGLWAAAETYTLAPNTTYYIRILTLVTGSITICGRNYLPPNNNCSGALSIGPVPVPDNNATHKPWIMSNPEWLCAFTIENTAFYEYTVLNTGVSTIFIEDIACDNRGVSGDNGFQIGFFTGSCAALHYDTCKTGSGVIVTASTISLPAGTKVYVAIDGILGANCAYNISASNAALLSVKWKYFTAWKHGEKNRLRWATAQEVNNAYFEIERSPDGVSFSSIGRMQGKMHSNTLNEYASEDAINTSDVYYRIKQVDIDGNYSYSNVVKMKGIGYEEFKLQNAGGNSLTYTMNLQKAATLDFQVIDAFGRILSSERKSFRMGAQSGNVNIGFMSRGMYYLVVSDNGVRKTYPFFK